jgi:hypothetical protein
MDPASLIYGDNQHIALCRNSGCPGSQIIFASILIGNWQSLNDQVTIIPAAPLDPDTVYYLSAGSLLLSSSDCGNIAQGIRYFTEFTTAP